MGSHKYRYVLLVSVLSIAYILFGGGLKASARPYIQGDLQNNIPNNGSSPWLVVTRPGSNGMDAPKQQVVAYVPQGVSGFDFAMADACDNSVNDDSGFNNDTIFTFSQVSSITGGANAFIWNSGPDAWSVACSGGTDLIMHVNMVSGPSYPTNPVTIQSPTGPVTYEQISIIAATANNNNPYYVNRFKYSGATNNVLFGYAATGEGGNPNGASDQYTGIAYGQGAANGWGWSTDITFAMPCTIGGPNTALDSPVFFFDSDYQPSGAAVSPYWQDSSTSPDHRMIYELRWYNRQTGAFVSNASGILTGDNNKPDATPSFHFESQYVYQLIVSNVNFVNSIQVALPLRQINAISTCDTIPLPTDNASCVSATINTATITPGSTFSTTIVMRNTGTTTWTPSTYNLGSAIGQTNNFATNGGGEIRVSGLSGNVAPNNDATFTFNYTAPSSSGTFPFDFKMVHEGVAWFGATCGPSGGFTVIANITVSGHVYDASNTGIPYSITIYYSSSCPAGGPPGGAPSVVSDPGTGYYEFTVPEGTAFCIRTYSAYPRPLDMDGQYVRPTGGDGFKSCAEFTATRNPNYCSSYTYYGGQVAGKALADGTDRSVDGGYDIVYTRPEVTIAGVIYNAYNMGIVYSNITMRTCVAQPAVVTNASGYFSFTIHKGDGFCVQPQSGGPADLAAVNDRPWGEGYTSGTCNTYPGGYPSAPSKPAAPARNYCSEGSYEWQIAGRNAVAADGGSFTSFDRSRNDGYDFVFRFNPKLSCTVNPDITSEVGTAYYPDVTVTNTGDSHNPSVETGVIQLTIDGQTSIGDFTPSNTPLPYSTSISSITPTRPVGFAMSPPPPDIILNANQTYPISATYRPSPALPAGDDLPAILANGGFCDGAQSTRRVNEPYFKAYGADVITGKGFSTPVASPTCSTTSGNIYGWASGTGSSYKGAGTQYGAIAPGSILGFFTAGNRSVVDVPPKSLTFSNTTGTYGGGFGSAGVPCITDYFSDPADNPPNGGTRDPVVPETTIRNFFDSTDINAFAGLGKHRFTRTWAQTATPGFQVPLGTQVAIYIDGDLKIYGDITLATGAGTVDDMPNLAVIVRGNIYIENSVKRLDGLYVAQPSNLASPTNGRIYTCALPFALYDSHDLAAECGKNTTPLAINGALIAEQVKFLRTLFSLRDSTNSDNAPPSGGELINFGDGSGSGAGANTKAAEVINYTPEIYIAPSALKNPDLACAKVSCKYDSIFSLPPIY